MIVTDEMVEKLVITLSQSLRGWDDKPFEQLTPADWQRAGRAAIEAIAPMLIAQGMQKSAYLYRDWLAMQSDGGSFDKYLNFQANELAWRSKGEFAGAQELDSQSGTSWSNNRTGPPGASSQELDPK